MSNYIYMDNYTNDEKPKTQIDLRSLSDQAQKHSQEQPINNVTPLQLDSDTDNIVNLCNQKTNQLNMVIQNQQNVIGQLQSQLQNLHHENTKIEKFAYDNSKRIEQELPQVCKIKSNKKWTITILISIIVLIFTSTFTVNVIDRILDNHNVDLFSSTDKTNELLLFAIQFIIIVIVVRFILQLV